MTGRTLKVAILALLSLALASGILVWATAPAEGDLEPGLAVSEARGAEPEATETSSVSDLPMLPPPPTLETDDF